MASLGGVYAEQGDLRRRSSFDGGDGGEVRQGGRELILGGMYEVGSREHRMSSDRHSGTPRSNRMCLQ